MSRIFISYSRQDQAFAQQLTRDLEAWGVDVWIDQDEIVAGSKWSTAIQHGLDSSDLMLIIVSPDSMASENVEDEWQYFKDQGKPLIPIMWRPCQVHFQLHRLQYIPFHDQDYTAACEQLRNMLGRNSIQIEARRQSKPSRPAAPPKQQSELASTLVMSNVLPILPEPFEWIDIPAGQVTLEDDHGTFDVPAFTIAKYPITYAQYQVFIDASDGYHNTAWWQGLAAYDSHRSQPGDQRFKLANHPRENVSWWDAIAFCRWLSDKTHLVITLPTEKQWRRAAQSDDGRQYPWGNEFDANRCNTKESGRKQTTPVTQYPNGASPYGVLDMSGNVWEWCLNEYEKPTNIGTGGRAVRVLRGGSWFYAQFGARCASRLRYDPSSRYYYIGFRVVCVPYL